MTTGAAQTLLRKYRVIPGQRILLAGHGPFNFHVAIELAREGAEVIALAELSPAPGLWSAKALFDMYRGSRQLLAQGIQYRMELNRWKISPLYNHCISSVEQINNSLKVELALWNDGALKPGPNFEVDIVCTGYGFYPSNILLRSLGCSHRFDHSQKQLVTDRSDDLETTISGIYAVGDCAGLGGAKAAVEEGIIAGVHATNSLNYLLSSQLSQEHTTARTRLAQHRRFQSGLWRLFAGPKLNLHLAKPETEVCRCESVTLENIDFAIRDGCISVGQIKQYTRAGMGACQGRYCSALLAELVADKTHTPLDHHSFFAPRAPISPIRIGDIGRLGKAE
jgi:bacterioferritin-associated ferredoxin